MKENGRKIERDPEISSLYMLLSLKLMESDKHSFRSIEGVCEIGNEK